MAGIQGPLLGTLLLFHVGLAMAQIQFLERSEGDSVVLPCEAQPVDKAPYGVYLERSWLRPDKVLFMHTKSKFSPQPNADRERLSVSGDPSDRRVNVTLSRLQPSDTDRYFCRFMVENQSAEDISVPGRTEFFLLVHADVPAGAPADIELVQTCAGGSAVLPCLPPRGERSTVEGVSVTRRRAPEPVELLYNSKRHHGGGGVGGSITPSLPSRFHVERVHVTFAPGPGGISYNATLQRLQPEDSGLYSCQLQMHGRPDAAPGLGRRVFFVAVQGEDCGCSISSTLLYSLASAVVALVALVLVGLLVICKGKARRARKTRPPAPIYEEMLGVPPGRGKRAPKHLEEAETSEYRNCDVKKSCPENYYERPTGALYPRTEAQK